MLKPFITLILATGLVAVAHLPAVASGQYERVSSKTYVAKAKGSSRDDRDEVLDEALYKAAKKTLDRDYDWFRVVSREFETEKTDTRYRNGARESFERVPERRCGLLGCTESYRTSYRGDIDTGFDYREEEKHSVRLEYEMGTGRVSNTENVYDAREIKASK
jgi:flavin-binding protein dodecin